jgi:hypothetical protein
MLHGRGVVPNLDLMRQNATQVVVANHVLHFRAMIGLVMMTKEFPVQPLGYKTRQIGRSCVARYCETRLPLC